MAAREVAIVIKAKDQASKTFEGIGSKLRILSKGPIAAAAAVAVLGGAITKLAIDAAPLADIEKGFHSLAKTYEIDSKAMLAAMGKASRGTVADIDLMRQANRALVGSGKELGQEFGKSLPKLLEIARASAKLTGEDVGYMFESLVLGIKRGSPMIIDNTGLQLKLGEANEALAVKLGKSVDELTAQEKSIALLNATMEAGEGMVASMGDAELTAAEQMAVMRAEMKQATFELGKAFLPVLLKVSKILTKVITYLARKAIPIAKKFGKALDRYLGIAAKAIEGIGEAFEWLREGDTEAFLERLWFAMDEAFGSRVADMIYQFGDMLFGLRHAFQLLRAGDFPAFLDRLRYALANVFGPEMATHFTTFIGRAREVAIAMKTQFADPIEKAFSRAKAAVADWWEGVGGSKAILEDAQESWNTILDTIISHTVSFNSQLQENLQPALSWLDENVAPIAEALGPLVERLDEARQSLSEQLPEGGLIGGLKELDDLVPTITEKLEPAVTEIEKHSDKIKTVFGVLGTGIMTAILFRVLGPIGLIAGAVRIAKTAWDENWFGMRDTIKNVIDTEILPRLEKLRINLKSDGIDIEGVLLRLRERFAELKPMGQEVWGSMQKRWEAFWASFSLAAKPFTEHIAKWGSEEFLPRLPKLFDAATKFGKTLGETIEKLTEEISAFLKKHPGVKEFLQKMIDLIGTLVGSTIMGLLDLSLRTITGLLDTLTIALNTASWALQYVVQPALTLVIGFFDSLLSAINRVIAAVDWLRSKLSLPFSLPRIPGLSGIGARLGFEHGGVVPGPIGRPQLAVVHGGEEIYQRGARGRGGVVLDFRGAQFYGITQDFVEDLFKEHELIRELQGVRARNP